MTDHKHKWNVQGTIIVTGQILVSCSCGLDGYVMNATQKEWSDAFHYPHKWEGGDDRILIDDKSDIRTP